MAKYKLATAITVFVLPQATQSWNIPPHHGIPSSGIHTRKSMSTTTLSLSPNDILNQADNNFNVLKNNQLPLPTLQSSNEIAENIKNILLQFQKTMENIISNPQTTFTTIQTYVSDAITNIFTIMENKPIAESIFPLVQEKWNVILPILKDIPAPLAIIFTASFTYSMISLILFRDAPTPPSSPYPFKRYDPATARAYFDSRLDKVIIRSLQVASLSAKFGINLGLDYLNNNIEKNADLRAKQLTDLLTTLGPSFIKVGQSLSIRTDLLSPAYVRGLKSLQDQVPPFPSDEAYAMIEEELGMDVDEVFETLGEEPVAAASLGQVYKGTLKSDGRTVAVKVQRPDIMNEIALDMYLIRELAAILKRAFTLNTDLVATTDAWGVGFVDELNYFDEAENAIRFTESMQTTPLANVVFSPPVVEEYTSERILVTEWVDGVRLDRSDQKDVTVLCSIAMNTYLTMMLETGLLHCDPHPGNLLRTNDGKLCILDWGMVTRLDPNLQITLIEHMAHLTSKDYAEVPRDLLELGFIPKEKKDLIKDSGVVETLAEIYGAWTKGGGAASIDVNKVVSQLQALTAEKGNLFQIPAYFAYIAKSFSVLEGIGISNDPNYSIINECLPYVSKRLLTDENERTGGALGTFIFGPDKNDLENRIVSYDRVEQLVTGFGNYSTSASGALLGKEGTSRVEQFEETADQILDLVITEEETPLQSILIEQLAKIISSNSRSFWTYVREQSGTLPSGRSVLGSIVDPLGLWRTSPIVRMNELDVKTVDTTRSLITLFQEQSASNNVFNTDTMSNEEILQFSQVLFRKMWEKRKGLAFTGSRLANMLVKMTADKLERGERDLMILPEANEQQLPETQAEHIVPKVPAIKKSTRLETAEQLLTQFEREAA